MIARGFAFGPRAYLKSRWNQLDFCLVVITVIVFLADFLPQLASLRILRVFRSLRPLRIIARSAGLKVIISSLLCTLPAVANVFGVLLALQVQRYEV